MNKYRLVKFYEKKVKPPEDTADSNSKVDYEKVTTLFLNAVREPY